MAGLVLGPVKQTVLALVAVASEALREIDEVSDATLNLLTRRSTVAAKAALLPPLTGADSQTTNGNGEKQQQKQQQRQQRSSAPSTPTLPVSIERGEIPTDLRLRLLQEGFREQFVENRHQYILPTAHRLRALGQSYPWLSAAVSGTSTQQ